jgi:hypothetical protein
MQAVLKVKSKNSKFKKRLADESVALSSNALF